MYSNATYVICNWYVFRYSSIAICVYSSYVCKRTNKGQDNSFYRQGVTKNSALTIYLLAGNSSKATWLYITINVGIFIHIYVNRKETKDYQYALLLFDLKYKVFSIRIVISQSILSKYCVTFVALLIFRRLFVHLEDPIFFSLQDLLIYLFKK